MAGLSAAAQATQRGARVLVLEKGDRAAYKELEGVERANLKRVGMLAKPG